MKKVIFAALVVFGMASAAYAEMHNATGYGETKAEACAAAKRNAQDALSNLPEKIVAFGQCDCSEKRPSGWTCSIDYKVEKK